MSEAKNPVVSATVTRKPCRNCDKQIGVNPLRKLLQSVEEEGGRKSICVDPQPSG